MNVGELKAALNELADDSLILAVDNTDHAIDVTGAEQEDGYFYLKVDVD